MTAEAGGTMTHEADGAMTHERGLMASELLAPALTGALAATSTAVERVSRAHDDAEAVHDMRVGIRRMRTVLNAGRGLYGRKAAERLIDQLRTVSKATNALRDEEVLGDTIAMLELAPPLQATATAWIERRVALLGELRAMGLAMLDGSGIRHVLGALGDLAARPPKRDQDALDFAREQLLLARRELCALLPEVAARDGVALHRLRIRFKRLRYTAEMLAGSLRASPDEPVLPGAEAYLAVARHAAGFQKELGLIHDADVALETAKIARDLDEDTRAAVVLGLARIRDQLADRAMARLVSEVAALAMPGAAAGDR